MYHLTIKNVSRRDGKSAVAAAAYRSSRKLWNEREKQYSDFSRKQDVTHSEIITPDDTPLWAHDREQLWNRAEAAEKRKDARLCKEVQLAFQVEMSLEQNIELGRAFAQRFVALGLIVDFNIHDDEEGNPHGHMLLTTRPIEGDAFGKKNRSLDSNMFVTSTRRAWEELTNAALKNAGIAKSVDHRSLKAQGIDRPPQVHQGPRVREMVARGKQPESKVVRYRSKWGNVREVDYRKIDTGSRVERSQEVQAMETNYKELVEAQRQISELGKREPEKLDDIRAQDQNLVALHAKREHLITRVDREELERGLGLGETDQRELLDLWDRENRPVPDRDGRPVSPGSDHAQRDDRDDEQDGDRVQPYLRTEPPEQIREAPIEERRSERAISAERRQIERDLEMVQKDPLLSDDQKTEKIHRLMQQSAQLSEREMGLKREPAPQEVQERMDRDFDEADRQYERSRGVDNDKWWENELEPDRVDARHEDGSARDQTREVSRSETEGRRDDQGSDNDRWWESVREQEPDLRDDMRQEEREDRSRDKQR